MSPAGMDGCARSLVVADGPAVGRRYLRRILFTTPLIPLWGRA